nr:hypothetical protein Itr_chr08CG13970 [Ipomoea trifida]
MHDKPPKTLIASNSGANFSVFSPLAATGRCTHSHNNHQHRLDSPKPAAFIVLSGLHCLVESWADLKPHSRAKSSTKYPSLSSTLGSSLAALISDGGDAATVCGGVAWSLVVLGSLLAG